MKLNFFKLRFKNDLTIFLLFTLLIIIFYLPSYFNLAFDLNYYLAQEQISNNEKLFRNSVYDYNSRTGFLLHIKFLNFLFNYNLSYLPYFFLIYSLFFFFLFFKFIKFLFNFEIAISSSIILIISSTTIFWLPRHIDVVWPVYFLSFIFLFFKKDKATVVLSALFLNLSIYTKGITILFIFFPIFFTLFVEKKKLSQILLFYVFFTFFYFLIKILLNYYYSFSSYTYQESLNLIFSFIKNYPTNTLIINFFHFILSGFLDFFWNINAKRGLFFENPILFLTAIYFILFFFRDYFSIQEKKYVKLFYLSFVLFLPFSIYLGSLGSRYSQNFILIAFLHVFIVLCINQFFKKKYFLPIYFIIIFLSFTFFDTTNRTKKIIQNNYVLNIIAKKKISPIAKVKYKNYDSYLNYIKTINKEILIPNVLLLSELIVQTNSKFFLYNLPFNQIAVSNYWPYYDKNLDKRFSYNYLTTFNWRHYKLSENRKLPLALISEERVLNFMSSKNIKEIHITNFSIDKNLLFFFDRSENFKKINEITIGKNKNRKVYIYELIIKRKNSHKFLIDPYAIKFLERITDKALKNIYLKKINNLGVVIYK